MDEHAYEDERSLLPHDIDGRVLGLRRDMEDPIRLRQFQSKKPMLGEIDIAKLPTSLGTAAWLQIEDQAQVGSCQGHAQTSCIEIAAYHVTGKIRQYNRMFAYLASQKEDGINGDNGSTMTGGAKSATVNGLPLESSWPYSGRYPSGGWRSIPAKLWTEAKGTLLVGYRMLESYAEVLQWLANGVGGVAIGIDWNDSCTPDSQGRIQKYSRGERFRGGHALALCDWNKNFLDPQGRPYIDMFNSWGKSWGFQGRAFVLPAIVDYWCKNCEVVGYGLVQGDEIKPKVFDWNKQSFFS